MTNLNPHKSKSNLLMLAEHEGLDDLPRVNQSFAFLQGV